MSDKDRMSSSKRVVIIGVLVALALVFSYMETFIPVNIAIPGIKLGLANIVTIFAMKKLGTRDGIVVSVFRIFLATLLFGNLSMLIYSLAGAGVSILIMWIFMKINFFGITGISILGGVGHNAGQILVAAVLIKNTYIFYYLPVLILSGTISGIAIGIIAAILIKRVRI